MPDVESSAGQPPAKHRMLSCPINDLADEDLLNIFKHLPPYDRLSASEVCRRWKELSRVPWRDIMHLNLSPIPGKNIGAIIKQCPSLQNVFALDKVFVADELNVLSRVHVSSLNLYCCSCDIADPVGERFDIFSALLSGHLPNASWEELVLFDLSVIMKGCNSYKGHVTGGTLPVSLRRLHLSDLGIFDSEENECDSKDDTPDDELPEQPSILADLGRLQNLTCLILSSLNADCAIADALHGNDLFRELPKVQNLRELCLDFAIEGYIPPENAAGAIFGLQQLEVLFLHNVVFEFDESDFVKLTTKHPTMRILVITGEFGEEPDFDYIIPARRLYPNGFAALPVPMLHIFVGRRASETIQFTKSTSDALRIYPITAALPYFLDRAEIAPIFEGVWIAAQMKKAPSSDQSRGHIIAMPPLLFDYWMMSK